ncbi:hypothetical protein [Cetobacterium sp.]|uniref:hypothetical protein n=1 Tax=Cetobacterium sp. TaxID=2071632 RepID=UPI003F3B4CDC
MVSLLEELKIKNIISIDDSWDQEKKFLEMRVSPFLTDIDLTEEEEDIIDEISLFSELKEKDEELYVKIIEKIKSLDTNLEKLELILPPTLKKFSSIEEFKNDTSLNKEELTLFIIDVDMGDGSNDSLITLLELIGEKKFNSIILVYSNSIDFLETQEKKEQYFDDNKYDYKYMALIHPIKKGEEELIKLLKERIYISYLYGKLYNFLEEKKEVDKEIYKNIYLSTDICFDNNIIKVISGGETTIDLVKKLFVTHHNKISFSKRNYVNQKEELIEASNHFFKKHLEKLEENSSEENPSEENPNYKINEKIEVSDTYSLLDISVNSYYKDIYPGDLFKFTVKRSKKNKIKYGVLVTKSCDLLIRKTEGDVKRKASKVALIMFKEEKISLGTFTTKEKLLKEEEKLQNIKNGIQNGESLFPLKVIDNTAIAMVSEKIGLEYIDDYILDLCTLNEDGIAKISDEIDQALKFKSYYSKEYFKEFNIEEKVNLEIGKTILNLFDIPQENIAEKKNELLKVILENKIKDSDYLQLKKSTNNDIEFNIERVGRIGEDKALLLYQKCLFNLSKRGIDI